MKALSRTVYIGYQSKCFDGCKMPLRKTHYHLIIILSKTFALLELQNLARFNENFNDNLAYKDFKSDISKNIEPLTIILNPGIRK